MFSPRCANPDCGTAFDYRRGRLLRFHEIHSKDLLDAATATPVHFWLCDRCCRAYTLLYIDGRAVLTRIALQEWIGGHDEKPAAKNA